MKNKTIERMEKWKKVSKIAQEILNKDFLIIWTLDKYFNNGYFPIEVTELFSSNNNSFIWAKICVKNKEGVQIGRITYKFDNNTGELLEVFVKYYKKEEYDYTVQDKIFFMIRYYYRTGKILENLEDIIKEAKEIQEKSFQERLKYCENNLLKNSKKRVCKRRNLRNIITGLINEKIKKEGVEND